MKHKTKLLFFPPEAHSNSAAPVGVTSDKWLFLCRASSTSLAAGLVPSSLKCPTWPRITAALLVTIRNPLPRQGVAAAGTPSVKEFVRRGSSKAQLDRGVAQLSPQDTKHLLVFSSTGTARGPLSKSVGSQCAHLLEKHTLYLQLEWVLGSVQSDHSRRLHSTPSAISYHLPN